MPLTYVEKRELFQQLCQKTIRGIYEQHQSTPYKVYGWFRNKWNRFGASSGINKVGTATQAAWVVVSELVLRNVPLIGPRLAFIGAMAIQKGKAALLQSVVLDKTLGKDWINDPKEKQLMQGEFLAQKGAEALADAVRKADAAAEALKNYPVKNCETFNEYLSRFYYWQYRLMRVRYYQQVLIEYCLAVDEHITEVERIFNEQERDLKLKGPKIFDDPVWHQENCSTECCVYPWDKYPLVSTTADLKAMKLQPIVPKH